MYKNNLFPLHKIKKIKQIILQYETKISIEIKRNIYSLIIKDRFVLFEIMN